MGTIIANMRTTIALLAFLGLAAASPMPMNNTRTWGLGGGPTGCTTSDTSFDYLLLVQQWPATQPSASWPTGADITDFTLHGLWPSRTGSDVNTYPCTCTSEQFDSSRVSSPRPSSSANRPHCSRHSQRPASLQAALTRTATCQTQSRRPLVSHR